MRLIDADDLLERIKKEHANQAEQSPGGLYGAGPWAYADCYGMVLSAPTIEAALVVHGKWKCTGSDRERYFDSDGEAHYRSWKTYKCSMCGEDGFDGFKYCPNCGARMDAEGVEG